MTTRLGTRRAMTMIESVAVLIVVGVLATVTVVGVQAVFARALPKADKTRIISAQAAGRSLAATNTSQFPSDVTTRLLIDGVTVTTGASLDTMTLSVWRHSATTMVYAMRNGSGCIGLVDVVDSNTVSWVLDRNTSPANCSSGVLDTKVAYMPVAGAPDVEHPVMVDFDTGTPAAPTNLALSSTATGVNITWTASAGPGVTKYFVYRDSVFIAQLGPSATSYKDTAAPGGVQITYEVTAGNDTEDISSKAGPLSILTIPDAPATASAVVNEPSITLNWTAPPSGTVTGYRVYINNTEAWAGAGLTFTHDASNIAVPFTHATTFTYEVAAENGTGVGKRTQVIQLTSPAPPTGVTVTGTASGVLRVAWSASTTATSYKVFESAVQIGTVSAPTTQFDQTGRTIGTTYSYTVKAVNAAGTGPPSSPVVQGTAIDIPNAPSGLAGTPGDQSATFNWTAPSITAARPVSGYRVYRSSDSTLGCQAVGSGTTTCPVSGLTNGTAYTYTVRAYNGSGEGPDSAPAVVTPRTVPGAPTIGTVTSSGLTGIVNFTAPASNGGNAITGYEATCTSSNGGTTQTGSGASSPVDVNNLSAGSLYTCAARAQNAAGFGAFSTASSSFTPSYNPGVVSGVSATPGNAQVSVSWTAMTSTTNQPIAGYRVYRSGVFGCQAVGASTTGCVVTGLTNGTSYPFQVVAYYSTFEGPLSGAVSATPYTVPNAPAAPTVAAGVQSGSVTFAAPGFNGGSAITSYSAWCQSSNGGTARSNTGAGSPITVSSLDAGYNYTCQVAAFNAAGWGPYSAASAAAVPASPYSYPYPAFYGYPYPYPAFYGYPYPYPAFYGYPYPYPAFYGYPYPYPGYYPTPAGYGTP